MEFMILLFIQLHQQVFSAAITAARTSSSLKIAIIEPTAYIGGMATAGGIGLTDIGLIDTGKKKDSLFLLCLLN